MLQHVNHSVSLFSYVITCADACYRSASLHARARLCLDTLFFADPFSFSSHLTRRKKMTIFGLIETRGTVDIQIFSILPPVIYPRNLSVRHVDTKSRFASS